MKKTFLLFLSFIFVASCSQVDVPGARNLKIPQPTQASERRDAINERPDSVMYLPLGKDVLIPEVPPSDLLPSKIVGPFELRAETLAGALQLITSDYEIPMAFESDEALTRKVTVSNMKGPLNQVVNRVCSMADLYCAYEDGTLVIKETQTFTVSVPPVGGAEDIINAVASGIEGISGISPIIDTGTRTIIYEATQRTADNIERYFQRMRRSTAMIIFEMYIWEVSLDNGNATGISWDKIMEFGKFSSEISIPSGVPGDFAPISIGLPTTGDVDANDVVRFISSFGAVKTISQPQITMLSGSSSTLRAADTINYVSSLQRTVDDGEVSISTETDSVDTGFTLEVSADWDNSTVYSNIGIELQEFRQFETFGEGTETELQLPRTTEREVSTQVRIRPGDSLLLAGLVRETDQYNNEGPGFQNPIVPTTRNSQVSNVELVFLMKPRVIVYTTDKETGPVQKSLKQVNADAEEEAHAPQENTATGTNALGEVIKDVQEVKAIPPQEVGVTTEQTAVSSESESDPQPQEPSSVLLQDNVISRPEDADETGGGMTPQSVQKEVVEPEENPSDEGEDMQPKIGTVPLDLLNPN